MLIPLADTAHINCGGKAATLGALFTAGLPVPDGFVVPFDAQSHIGTGTWPVVPEALRENIFRELRRMGDPMVVVRSSAADEDSATTSAAGQYESVLGVQGLDEVCRAITACWKSATSTRVANYRHRTGDGTSVSIPQMAVLVQHMIAADVSGVMFTPLHEGEPTRIEASWGLGTSVVDGSVTPDSYEITAHGVVNCTIGSKETRTDLSNQQPGITTRAMDKTTRITALDTATAVTLAELGSRIAQLLDSPQDIEWAISGNKIWILQSRPITAELPAIPSTCSDVTGATLTGTPGSHGRITANARVVQGPSDFATVQPGEVMICPYTDPAWTPLFTIASGVVTETGGALSHAAIVAREYGIPAVLGAEHAMTRIQDGDRITLDGTAGTITIL